MGLENSLPLKSIVLFIAVGLLVFSIVFIFAKRQIARFALKGRGPHKPIGADAPKHLKQEIERRLNRATEIKYEPTLLTEELEQKCNSLPKGETPYFYYRMKAVDALKQLDQEFLKYSPNIKRQYGSNLRAFLIEQRQNGPLHGVKLEIVEKFCDYYDHARHDPCEFSKKEYTQFMDLLQQLSKVIRDKMGGQQQMMVTGIIPNGSSPREDKPETSSQLSYRPRTDDYNTGKRHSEAEASLLILDQSSVTSSLEDEARRIGLSGTPV